VDIEEILGAIRQDLEPFYDSKNNSRKARGHLARHPACQAALVSMDDEETCTLVRLDGVMSFFGLKGLVRGADT
jgi:hypothetical protein